MWSRAVFLGYGRNFNVALNKTKNGLVAVKHIQPGDRIRLQPPQSQPAPEALRRSFPLQSDAASNLLNSRYDVENESWFDQKTA